MCINTLKKISSDQKHVILIIAFTRKIPHRNVSFRQKDLKKTLLPDTLSVLIIFFLIKKQMDLTSFLWQKVV